MPNGPLTLPALAHTPPTYAASAAAAAAAAADATADATATAAAATAAAASSADPAAPSETSGNFPSGVRTFLSFREVSGLMDAFFPLRCNASEHVELCERLNVPPEMRVRIFPLERAERLGRPSASYTERRSKNSSDGGGGDLSVTGVAIVRGASDSLTAAVSTSLSLAVSTACSLAVTPPASSNGSFVAGSKSPTALERRPSQSPQLSPRFGSSDGLSVLRRAASTNNALPALSPAAQDA
ncbi:hypothetical protein T492DRAFT_992758 [Pavlovales sp. CCMP2436]|nr:hypothetical protein T492DRAFT_992758 [Pavlovales sp. CCMP2436]